MVIEGFSWFGARHAEVGAFRNILGFYGVKAPHTGQPFSEQFLYGVGGGIGFAYFLFERRGEHPIFLGTRIHTRETERPEYFQIIAQRTGVEAAVQNSSSANAALSNTKKALAAGKPLLVWTDGARLPYTGLYGFGNFYHVVVAFGMDETAGTVQVSDRPPSPETITWQEFRHARETSWSPKYRAMTVGTGAGDPRVAAEQGIRSCVEQMTTGLGIANFGLNGLDKWSTMLTSSKEKKSWLKMFPPGGPLYRSLFSIYDQIATRGDIGAAGRCFYAEFLEEASDLLAKPGLRDVAAQYRQLDGVWQALADAHLPDSVPLFAESRRLANERKSLFETKGAAARDRLDEIRHRLTDIEQQCTAEFPLQPNEIRPLLADLRQHILHVREQEAGAVQALAGAMG